jgi:hypothetical protein
MGKKILAIAVFTPDDRMEYIRAPYDTKTDGEITIHVMDADQLEDLYRCVGLALSRVKPRVHA